MTGYVLDASVAAKWVLPAKGEPFAPEANRLLHRFGEGEIDLSVPDLFWPEVGNIVWKCVRSGRISRVAAQEALDWLEGLRIPTSPSKPLLSDAVWIALRFERTVYDAMYLALATASARQFLTADERLANAVAAHFPVIWLGALV